jgi:hypothetical protein
MAAPRVSARSPRSAGAGLPVWACVGAAAATIVGAASVLLWMGRVPVSTTGAVRLWSGDAWGPENSQQLFDPYSFTHVTHGVLIYGLLFLLARRVPLRSRGVLAVALEALWEVGENTNAVIDRYREVTMALGYYGDSVLNSVGDILACVIGFTLAARLSVRTTVCFVLGLEVVLALWIRDSLLLNVVMLIYPIEAVRTWQLELVRTESEEQITVP